VERKGPPEMNLRDLRAIIQETLVGTGPPAP
jgi:hypothetical protein